MGAFWQFLLLCIVLILISDDTTLAIRCFNCSTSSKSHNCTDSEFSSNNNSVECPELSVGCMLEINGKHERRACSSLAINDCKLANSINYCYCIWDNCNGNALKLIEELKKLHQDDENESQSSESEHTTDNNDDEEDGYYEASSDSDLTQLDTKTDVNGDDELTTDISNYTEINTKNSGMDCNLVLLVKLLCSMLVFKIYFNVEFG